MNLGSDQSCVAQHPGSRLMNSPQHIRITIKCTIIQTIQLLLILDFLSHIFCHLLMEIW